jgi:hypothetical protein
MQFSWRSVTKLIVEADEAGERSNPAGSVLLSPAADLQKAITRQLRNGGGRDRLEAYCRHQH